MKKYLLFIPILSLSFITSCNKNNDNNNEKHVFKDENEFLDYFSNKLRSLSEGCSTKTYKTDQTDIYGSLEINVKEEGFLNRYKDDFIHGESLQIFEEDEINLVKEIGIIDEDYLYTILDFDDEINDKVKLQNYDSFYHEYYFSVGFSEDYLVNGLELAREEISSGLVSRYEFKYNYHDVDLSKDGVHTLQLRYKVLSGDIVEYHFDRDDIITIKNGKIVSSTSTLLYGLMDDVNAQYLESSATYSYEPFKNYAGEKLNPDNYPIVS